MVRGWGQWNCFFSAFHRLQRAVSGKIWSDNERFWKVGQVWLLAITLYQSYWKSEIKCCSCADPSAKTISGMAVLESRSKCWVKYQICLQCLVVTLGTSSSTFFNVAPLLSIMIKLMLGTGIRLCNIADAWLNEVVNQLMVITVGRFWWWKLLITLQSSSI